jgi:hypothetical protein
MFVGQGVLTGGIENDERAVRNDSRKLVVMNGINAIAATADPDLAEVFRSFRLDDAVDVFSLLGVGLWAWPCSFIYRNLIDPNTTIQARCQRPPAASP